MTSSGSEEERPRQDPPVRASRQKVAEALSAMVPYLPHLLVAVLALVVLWQAVGLRQADSGTSQAEMVRLILEDSKQARGQWQEWASRAEKLQTVLDSGGGSQEPLRSDLAGLKQQIGAWENKWASFKTTLDGLAARNPDLSDVFVGKVADRVATTLEDTLGRKVQQPLTNLQLDSHRLLTTLKSFQDQLRRETARRDVALILFHARHLDAMMTLPVIKEVVEGHPYRLNFPHYRLGVYVAANRKFIKTIKPLEAPEPPLDKSGKKLKADPYKPELEDRKNSNEFPESLRVGEDIFAKAKSDTVKGVRRCVFVLSAECPAPDRVADWDGLAVHVILVETASPKDPADQKRAERLAAWERLCRRHEGAAHLVRVQPANDHFVSEDAEALRRRLHWSISPF